MQDLAPLYRFRSLKYGIGELRDSYLYFSTFDELNDPMECFYRLFFKENKELYENFFKHFLENMCQHSGIAKQHTHNNNAHFNDYLQEVIKRLANNVLWAEDLKPTLTDIYNKYYGKQRYIYHKINKYIKELKGRVINEKLICAFSRLGGSVILKCGEILMWAHYADGFKGFCLEFSEIKVQDGSLQNKLTHKDIDYRNNDIKNLQFSVGLCVAGNANKLDINNTPPKQLQLKYNDKYETIYNTKLKAWKYEKEHRYSILKKYLPEQRLYYDFKCLKSITFGTRIPLKEQRKIINNIKQKCQQYNHKVKFYKVKIDENSGVLIRKELANLDEMY
ncbi:DUF2971 domain-containing protein [Helicobacter sp. 23-1045]